MIFIIFFLVQMRDKWNILCEFAPIQLYGNEG